MTRTGVFTPQDARMVLEVVRYLRENGFVIPGGRRPEQVQQQDRIWFRNDSGGQVPAFACMEVTGTAEAGGQNYVTITKPTSGGVSFIFNGQAPVENGEYGMAQSGPIIRGYKSTGTVTEGDHWRPTVADWFLTQDAGGQFVAVGSDDIETDVFKLVVQSLTVEVTVVTDIRVSGVNLQYKTRTLRVPVAGTESAWTTWHAGTECP